MTNIEWTDATMRMAGTRLREHGLYAALTEPSKAGPVWNGTTRAAPPEVLTQPLHWRKARRVFVCSMSDLFYEGHSDEDIARVFAVMALCPQHTFQVLTKRAARMRSFFVTIGDDAADSCLAEGRARTIDPGKLATLLVVVTLAVTWAYRCATRTMGTKAIRRKSHGRREKSWFRIGLDSLRNWIIHRPEKAIAAWTQTCPRRTFKQGLSA